ncbi:formate-dependent phosphoribosylglycinamide formyltransferase [Shewanella glacialimarina]|uniref:formate-dependent phosphoribosylglycinamide formyltransferase n=1 Tax=Shewanella glacialimarina TaxID=2590884 RepID=UPI001CF80BC3|nr:formate-dependent phosphoribosylglycinamide formyltransferase [Shewanella glacialimarina]UCX06571.1 formate-dependent phosphoribosylglycinamide formyltransferase [Shewanella glacialimarina]
MLGTPGCTDAVKAMLLGCGELGKEVAIELQRFGIEVIGVDRYPNAPAMQIAHRSHVINMLDGAALSAVIELEKPDIVIPEIEAIATDMLLALEAKGLNVVPCAQAAKLTMDREGIRRLAAETLGLPTSAYFFCDTLIELNQAIAQIGFPCVIKPVMSSSGKGQSVIKSTDDIQAAWDYAQQGGRAGQGRVIIEGFIPFDYEITLLTISAIDGIHFCAPIGHRQEDGDYRESWQPQAMPDHVLEQAQIVAMKTVKALGGYGLFGVELFIKGDEVYFSEVSPRPHDTGLVTLISQDLSEFALHVRAILGLPIGKIEQFGPAASAVILAEGKSDNIRYQGMGKALALPDTQLRLFGKPDIDGRRRLGVALAKDTSIENAIEKAKKAAAEIKVLL